MRGETFTHDSRSGQWIYTIYIIEAGDDAFSAVADVELHRQQRCKLVVSLPRTARAAGLEALKRKCIEWIEQAEARGIGLPASASPQDAA